MLQGTCASPSSGDVEVIDVTGNLGRRDAREIAARVHRALGVGSRRFVVDLTQADAVQEATLTLALLGVRSSLARAEGRLVVAARNDVAERLAATLRMDRVLGATASRCAALSHART
jgi:anti-anti-sigma regulatory factor